MKVIIFHREDMWYPTEYPNDYSDWQAEANRNPGTTKIETFDGEVLWMPKGKTCFLDTPELNYRFQLIEDISENIRHLTLEHQLTIVFGWHSLDTIERMHKTICKDKY